MKITKQRLQRIIQEELQGILLEQGNDPADLVHMSKLPGSVHEFLKTGKAVNDDGSAEPRVQAVVDIWRRVVSAGKTDSTLQGGAPGSPEHLVQQADAAGRKAFKSHLRELKRIVGKI